MDRRSELTAFLRSRRARLDPDQVGVPSYGGGRPRRVPGLRREELAALAGLSVDYYIRLEQGRATNVSEAVLDAVARALRLDHDEVASGLFRRLWADHPVASKGHSLVWIRHPIAGRMQLAYQSLSPPDDPDQVLVAYSAQPGSPSAEALRALASWHASATRESTVVDLL